METQQPTTRQIEEMVAFLPLLYAVGHNPVKCWTGGESEQEDEVFVLPWPKYDEVVEEFYRTAGSPWWCDYGYDPAEAGKMLASQEAVMIAFLTQVKSMLTYCVRGERFCEGHWAAMIKEGHIRRLLERLDKLYSEDIPDVATVASKGRR